MKVIIAGKRDYVNYQTLCDAVQESGFEITEIVSGGATGVDALGERYAKENSIPLKRFPAEWNKHGKSAGPRRNKQMAEYGEALIALWNGNSAGTKNMIDNAKMKNLKIYVKEI